MTRTEKIEKAFSLIRYNSPSKETKAFREEIKKLFRPAVYHLEGQKKKRSLRNA
jgi:hypothetical protein